MKASALQAFLRSLGGSLAVVGIPPKSLEDIHKVAHALEPFKDLDLEQLSDFLNRAAEHRRTGDVPVVVIPGVEDAGTNARSLAETVQLLGAADESLESQNASRLSHGKRELQGALTKIAGEFGLIAKFTEDKKWLPSILAKSAVTKVVEEVRRLAPLISETGSYESEAVQTAISKHAHVDAKVLKAVAAELGVSAKGKGKQFIESLLVGVTGITNKPTKEKKKVASEPSATDEQVEAVVKTLQDMVERAKDPKAVSDNEVEAILARTAAEFSTGQQKIIAERVTGKGGKTAADSIARLRAELTAVKNLVESQNV